MITKQQFLLGVCLSFSVFSLFPLIDPSPYLTQALAWHANHIESDGMLLVSLEELQLVANLFYFSYLRSAATIKGQEAARAALDTLWHGWQNIAHTRMNPSHKAPYIFDPITQEACYHRFIEAQKEHRYAAQAYANLTQALIKQHYFTQPTHDAITKLRDHARSIVAQAFLDAKKILGNLYDLAMHGMRSEPEQEPELRFDMLQMISSYLPILSLQTFIDAERAQLTMAEQGWEIISTMLQVNMTIWHEIETARASYYLAYYQIMSSIMKRHQVPKKYWTIIVDENGLHPKNSPVLPTITL